MENIYPKFKWLKNWIWFGGKVIHGDGFGKKLGYPTANITRQRFYRNNWDQIVKEGVYAGTVSLGLKNYKAGIVIGPKDNEGKLKLEAHLIGFNGDLYGEYINFNLKAYLRPFTKYESEQKLREEITRDINFIKTLPMKFLEKYGAWLVFLAAMLWATDAPFRVHLTRELSSSFIVLAEHFIDVLFVLPILWWKRSELGRLGKKEWIAVLVIAIGSSALASVAFTKAFSYVNPSVAILLQKLQPLIAIGLAASLLKEELRSKFWTWAVLAIVGAYLISFPGLKPQLFAGEVFNPNAIGVVLAVTAAILWGAGTVLGKLVLNKVSFQTMTSLRFILAFVFLLFMNLFQKTIPAFSSISGKDWFYFVIIAITSGVVSLFLYYRGLQFTKASIATLAELGFPLAAVLVNYLFLHDNLVTAQLLGMIVLLFSVFQLGRLGHQPKQN